MAQIGHALGVLPLGGDGRVLGGRRGEAGVGVGGRACPTAGVQSSPFQSVRWAGRLVGHALPPDVAVVGQRGVGEDAVAVEGEHGVGVGVGVGAGRHAEEAGLGVDGVEAAVGAELHPADVVADRLDLPALDGGDEHGQVGLAAGRREGAGDVAGLALGGGELQDEHVLGQPAVVAGHDRGDAQREALLAEQRVAAVARAVARRSRGSRGSGRCTCSRRCTARRRPAGPARAGRRPSAGRARTRRRRRAPRGRPCPCGS